MGVQETETGAIPKKAAGVSILAFVCFLHDQADPPLGVGFNCRDHLAAIGTPWGRLDGTEASLAVCLASRYASKHGCYRPVVDEQATRMLGQPPGNAVQRCDCVLTIFSCSPFHWHTLAPEECIKLAREVPEGSPMTSKTNGALGPRMLSMTRLTGMDVYASGQDRPSGK